MATIGSVVLRIEAQHDQVTVGLREVGKDVEEFGGKVHELGSGLAEGLGIGAGIEIAKAGIEAVTESIHKAVDAIREWVAASLENATATFRSAAALHLHADTLGGLQAAGKRAGIGADEMTEALMKTNHAIGEAATKGGEGAAAFAKLGLNARTLAGQGLDQSIRQIADALGNVKNPAEQAAAAGAIFGERLGPKLLPLLQQGSAGIQKAIDLAKEAGTALSDVDDAKLVNAQRSLAEVGERFDGIKNQLAIALAPAITEIGNDVLGLLPSADTMRNAFMQAFQLVVGFAAGAGDAIAAIAVPILRVDAAAARLSARLSVGSVSEFFKQAAADADRLADKMDNSDLAGKASKWLAQIENNADKAAKQLAKSLDTPIAAIGPMVNEHAKEIAEVLKHLQESADSVGGQRPKELIDLKNMQATNGQLETAQKLLDKISQTKLHLEVDKSLEEMAHQIATFSMSEGQKKLFDLKGATAEQLATAQAYADQLDKLADKKKEQEDANKLIADSLNNSPLDKYSNELDKINTLYEDGLISAKVYAESISKANKDLRASFKEGGETRKIGADTRRFDFRGPVQERKTDPIAALARTAEKQAQDVADSKWYLKQSYLFQQNASRTADQIVGWANGSSTP